MATCTSSTGSSDVWDRVECADAGAIRDVRARLGNPGTALRRSQCASVPKAFDLLSILVADRPKAISKSDLQERLWPATFVVEKNLANLVSEIRDALGDDLSRLRFIRTVHRFGYAFRETLPRPEARLRASRGGEASVV